MNDLLIAILFNSPLIMLVIFEIWYGYDCLKNVGKL